MMRKCVTMAAILRNAKNWPLLCLNRIWSGFYQGPVRLRSGLVLHPAPDLTRCWGEIFEPAIADVYGLRTMTAPDAIWDIGANIGSFTCVARRAFPGARITAYEPDVRTIEALRANLDANGISDIVVVPHPVTRDGREVVFVKVADGAASNIFSQGEQAGTRLTSTTLSAEGLRTGDRLFVKMDCEGAEGEIVEWICDHAAALPSKMRMVAEYHPWCPVSPEKISTLLRTAGFTVRWTERFGESYFEALRDWA